MTMRIDGEKVVEHDLEYGVEQASTDSTTRIIWYEDRDDAVLEQGTFGGVLVVRDCWKSEPRIAEPDQEGLPLDA